MSDVNTAHTGPTHQDDEPFDDDDYTCEVIELTDEQCQSMVENTILLSGFSKEELISQAEEGRFKNGLARGDYIRECQDRWGVV